MKANGDLKFDGVELDDVIAWHNFLNSKENLDEKGKRVWDGEEDAYAWLSDPSRGTKFSQKAKPREATKVDPYTADAPTEFVTPADAGSTPERNTEPSRGTVLDAEKAAAALGNRRRARLINVLLERENGKLPYDERFPVNTGYDSLDTAITAMREKEKAAAAETTKKAGPSTAQARLDEKLADIQDRIESTVAGMNQDEVDAMLLDVLRPDRGVKFINEDAPPELGLDDKPVGRPANPDTQQLREAKMYGFKKTIGAGNRGAKYAEQRKAMGKSSDLLGATPKDLSGDSAATRRERLRRLQALGKSEVEIRKAGLGAELDNPDTHRATVKPAKPGEKPGPSAVRIKAGESLPEGFHEGELSESPGAAESARETVNTVLRPDDEAADEALAKAAKGMNPTQLHVLMQSLTKQRESGKISESRYLSALRIVASNLTGAPKDKVSKRDTKDKPKRGPNGFVAPDFDEE
jgi:hypothetical protein